MLGDKRGGENHAVHARHRARGGRPMTVLLLAALIWIGVHVGIAGTRVRGVVVARIGDMAFRGVFSAVSIAAIIVLVRAWSTSPAEPIWFTPDWLRWILVLAMLPAFVLFLASISQPSPTMIGPPGATTRPPRGMIRVTRHPMLCSFAIWAAVHVIGNGDSASVVFFGAFLVTALAGMPSIDAKLARRDPATWQALSAATSIVPFAAIAAGRNRFVPREVGVVTPLVAVVAWMALLLLHPVLFGTAPAAW
jgi:uncharacterized membrane protein